MGNCQSQFSEIKQNLYLIYNFPLFIFLFQKCRGANKTWCLISIVKQSSGWYKTGERRKQNINDEELWPNKDLQGWNVASF